MTSKTLLRRSKILLRSVERIALRIETGKLTPSTTIAIDHDGKPVCAFGHVVVDAHRRTKTLVRPTVFNSDALVNFVGDGIYSSGVSDKARERLLDAANDIGNVGDKIFSDLAVEESKEIEKKERKKMARLLRAFGKVLTKTIIVPVEKFLVD